MKVKRISAITLFVKDMKTSTEFYSKIPGFYLVCGGSSSNFTTFEIGDNEKMYLNLELKDHKKTDFGRIIFHVDDTDEFYMYLKSDNFISNSAVFENKPTDAAWGEHFFHLRDPDNYQLSFAMPIKINEIPYNEDDTLEKKKRKYKPVYRKRYRKK